MIDPEVQDKIQSYLKPNEKLLWADKPHKYPVRGLTIMTWAKIAWFCFILVWLLFDIVFSGEFSSYKQKIIGILILAFFGGFGWLAMKVCFKFLLGPIHEVYGLTDDRAIIISPYENLQIVSVRPEKMRDIRVRGRKNIGTIWFSQIKLNVWKFGDKYDFGVNRGDLSAFHNIKNPREVEALIRKTFTTKGRTQ